MEDVKFLRLDGKSYPCYFDSRSVGPLEPRSLTGVKPASVYSDVVILPRSFIETVRGEEKDVWYLAAIEFDTRVNKSKIGIYLYTKRTSKIVSNHIDEQEDAYVIDLLFAEPRFVTGLITNGNHADIEYFVHCIGLNSFCPYNALAFGKGTKIDVYTKKDGLLLENLLHGR